MRKNARTPYRGCFSRLYDIKKKLSLGGYLTLSVLLSNMLGLLYPVSVISRRKVLLGCIDMTFNLRLVSIFVNYNDDGTMITVIIGINTIYY